MMEKVSINEFELNYVELFRVALSEETAELRRVGIKNVRHDVVSSRLELLFNEIGPEGTSDPTNAGFMQWAATSANQRSEAAFEFSETGRRYEKRNEKKLNIAEEVGFLVYNTIQDQRFWGIHTPGGIFEQIRAQAKEENVHGAKDRTVLGELWSTYKGVVHLGMAIKYREENPDQAFGTLELADLFRRMLGENCPKGTSKPYVDPSEQISFVYKSRLWGPRFGNRGLPYGVE